MEFLALINLKKIFFSPQDIEYMCKKCVKRRACKEMKAKRNNQTVVDFMLKFNHPAILKSKTILHNYTGITVIRSVFLSSKVAANMPKQP